LLAVPLATLSSDFTKNYFSGLRCHLRQPPAIVEDRCSSVKVFSLS
jgi:hypothetical protein